MKTIYLINFVIAVYMQDLCTSQCIYNCRYCNNGQCTDCNDGFYLDYYQSGNQWYAYCNQCRVNCTSCTSRDYCNSCKLGYTGSKCETCLMGYYGYNEFCYQCSERCISCTDLSNCNECKTGYYGRVCDLSCLSGCQGGVCNKETGACTCSAAFTGSNCDSCLPGYYGDECRPCSYGCQDTCDRSSGTCSCKPTYSGLSCGTCIEGRYGQYCTQTCRQNCKSCMEENTCLSCTQGFYGPVCGNVCPNNCLTCVSSDECLQCKSGYYGTACQISCGVGCLNGLCDKQSGACSPCMGGYREPKCTQYCSEGCIDKLCHQNDAVCTLGCKPGYSSSAYCCQPGMFGWSCKMNCPTNCATCTSLTECQTCKEAFYGSQCNQKCLTCSMASVFGANCDIPCCNTCNNSSCHMNGTCKSGCISDYFGPSCEQSCPTNCARSGNGTRCSHATGLCLFGCNDGFKGESCMEVHKLDNNKDTVQVAAIGGGVAAAVVVVLVVVVVISIFIRQRNRMLYDNVVRDANADRSEHAYDGIHLNVSAETAKECSTTVVSTDYQNTSDRHSKSPEQIEKEEHTYEITL